MEGYSILLTKEWTEIYFSLYGHKKKVSGDVCRETLEFRVTQKKNGQYVLVYLQEVVLCLQGRVYHIYFKDKITA